MKSAKDRRAELAQEFEQQRQLRLGQARNFTSMLATAVQSCGVYIKGVDRDGKYTIGLTSDQPASALKLTDGLDATVDRALQGQLAHTKLGEEFHLLNNYVVRTEKINWVLAREKRAKEYLALCKQVGKLKVAIDKEALSSVKKQYPHLR